MQGNKREKTRLTKAEQNSINRIRQSAQIIESLVPLEVKRSSNARKKAMENAWASISTHMYNLGYAPPTMGIWYNPATYLDKARECVKIVNRLEARYKQD